MSVKQIAIGSITSIIVAGTVGYGSTNYAAGEMRAQVNSNTQMLRDRQSLVDNANSFDIRLKFMEKRQDLLETVIAENQKEQRDIAYKILAEISAMRQETTKNSTKIGSIETDISEIKDRLQK